MNKKTIYIKGMHCPSCETILTEEFSKVKGVKKVTVSRHENKADIFFEGPTPDAGKIRKIVEQYGYQVADRSVAPKKTEITDWISAVLIVLAAALLFNYFQGSSLINSFKVRTDSVTYGVAFMVGLLASVSSCLAVVGSVVIAFSQKYESGGKGAYQTAVMPNILFQAGRLGTFFLLGGVLGALGGTISLSGNFISVFSIIIAVVMGLLALNILGLLPSLPSLGIKAPGALSQKWTSLKNSNEKHAPLALGALSFFLPCGFTQSMQIFALASGSFLTGSLVMFLFALGTAPVLATVGIVSSLTKNKGIVVLQKAAGMILLLFAVYTLNSGLALRGVSGDIISSPDKKGDSVPAPNPDEKKDAQVVTMDVTPAGFSPSVLKVKKGTPVRWVINGDEASGCTNKIIIPSLNISKPIKNGENVVTFTPDKAGEIPFSCWMGMVRGKFIVE